MYGLVVVRRVLGCSSEVPSGSEYNPKPLKVGRMKGPLYKDSYFGIISPVEFFGRCRAVRHSLSHEVLYGEHEVHERAGGARGMA